MLLKIGLPQQISCNGPLSSDQTFEMVIIFSSSLAIGAMASNKLLKE
jgi:hypothetical protein